jgi:hypothetical protein
VPRVYMVGRGALPAGRSLTVRTGGPRASDDAGTSSEKRSEKLLRRKPKVSWGRQFRPGLAGTLGEAERRNRWRAG